MDDKVVFIKTKEEENPKPTWKERKISVSIGTVAYILIVIALIGGGLLAGRYLLPAEKPVWEYNLSIGGNNNHKEEKNDTISPEISPQNTTDKDVQGAGGENSTDVDEQTGNDEDVVEYTTATSYSNSRLTITEIDFEWLEEQQYGRIEKIYYSLTNGESGIIKAEMAMIMLQGYEHPYYASIPFSGKSTSPDKTTKSSVTKRIAYSPTVIDLETASITITLFDAENRTIAEDTLTKNIGP